MLASQKGTKTQPKKTEMSNDSEQIELALSKIDDPKVSFISAIAVVYDFLRLISTREILMIPWGV